MKTKHQSFTLSLFHSFTLSLLMLSLQLSAQTIYKNSKYTLTGSSVSQGQYKAVAMSATEMTSNYKPLEEKRMAEPKVITAVNREHWQLKQDISQLPHYKSSLPLDNALYNMSLEESLLAIEPDSTFRTGIFWGGVWTRDVSYSILHSLAQLQPEVSMQSLRHKVTQNNRIIQDTGTGGAYPCSTDRIVWTLAAWEIYKVTGSREWLDYIYPIIRNTVEDDRTVALDPHTGLLHGETSWLDWREQEYPLWAEPADIYQSEALGTNAVHYQAVRILARISELEGNSQDAKKYSRYAESIKEAINKNLWMSDRGCYGIYLLGRDNLRLMPQQEILGQALCVLYGIADKDQALSVTQNMAEEAFGTPDLYPNLHDQYPYHNDAMWPFTQGYWMKACKETQNEEATLFSIASIYRAAGLFLTNQENMVITTGDYMGLPINSPRMLWALAANASIPVNIYFGISYEEDGLRFSPFVPKQLKAKRSLSNFKYRDAVLNMTISGYGNQIKSFRLDGKETEPFFPASLTGTHQIDIVLSNQQPAKQPVNYVDNDYLPATPEATLTNGQLTWKAVDGAKEYKVLLNGKPVFTTTALSYPVSASGEYSVVAVGKNGWESFMSNPLRNYAKVQSIELRDKSLEYTEISRNKNVFLPVTVQVDEEADYILYWQYANGNGPINTENKCCIRELKVDGLSHGVSIFPHRGTGAWDNLGYSNSHHVHLTKGTHVVSLEFTDKTENMNPATNEARLYRLYLSK